MQRCIIIIKLPLVSFNDIKFELNESNFDGFVIVSMIFSCRDFGWIVLNEMKVLFITHETITIKVLLFSI